MPDIKKNFFKRRILITLPNCLNFHHGPCVRHALNFMSLHTRAVVIVNIMFQLVKKKLSLLEALADIQVPYSLRYYYPLVHSYLAFILIFMLSYLNIRWYFSKFRLYIIISLYSFLKVFFSKSIFSSFIFLFCVHILH